MTTPGALYAHRHVSEREVAHTWPDGQKDDARWEDCTWCVSLEWYRLVRDADKPATHAEAEALRDASGKGPSGGSNLGDVVDAFRERYHDAGPFEIIHGTNEIMAALKPGFVATVSGSMAAFSAGDSLRRWDPPFHAGHQVLMARVDNLPRLWWCDPLAPQGDYEGQWVTINQARAFLNALGGGFAIVGRIKARPTEPQPIERVRVTGAWWPYTVTGNRATGYSVTRPRTSLVTAGFTGGIDTEVRVEYGGKVRRLGHLCNGIYRGKWVDLEDEQVLPK